MARAYFFNGGAFGHINPTLGLVAELVKRGEEIIYYATEEFRQVIEGTGATYRPYPAPPPDEQITGHEHLAAYLLRWGASVLPGLIEQARDNRPDYILFDSQRPWGPQLARMLNVPAISSYPGFAMTIPALLLTSPGLVYSLFFRRGEAGSGPDYAEQYRQTAEAIRAQHSVESPWPPMRVLNLCGDITLLFTVRELQPAAFTLNRSFKFIGACIRQRDDAPAFPVERLQGKPVLFISLGTVFHYNLDFWQMCINAFGDSQYTVLMAVGPGIDVHAFGRVPDNIIIENYVRQLDVFPHTALHINHGGMGSTQEALYHDVPLIVVPQMFAQELVARQVARSGAGIHLKPETVTVEQLRASVERVLNTASFKHHAARLGRAFRQTDASTAADIVQRSLHEIGQSAH
jgi:MGT family glycosyltransferase